MLNNRCAHTITVLPFHNLYFSKIKLLLKIKDFAFKKQVAELTGDSVNEYYSHIKMHDRSFV